MGYTVFMDHHVGRVFNDLSIDGDGNGNENGNFLKFRIWFR